MFGVLRLGSGLDPQSTVAGELLGHVGGEPPAVAVFVMSADGAGKEQLTD
jgi:hypothetical protein